MGLALIQQSFEIRGQSLLFFNQGVDLIPWPLVEPRSYCSGEDRGQLRQTDHDGPVQSVALLAGNSGNGRGLYKIGNTGDFVEIPSSWQGAAAFVHLAARPLPCKLRLLPHGLRGFSLQPRALPHKFRLLDDSSGLLLKQIGDPHDPACLVADRAAGADEQVEFAEPSSRRPIRWNNKVKDRAVWLSSRSGE